MAPANTVSYRNPAIVTARPVVPPPIALYNQPDALVAGSQLNQAAVGGPTKATQLGSGSSLNKARAGAPWPGIINGATKFFNSWRKNNLREISNHNVIGNYGSNTGIVNFGWRGREFPSGIAGMAITDIKGAGHRPEWNTVIPIIYGMRVVNPVAGGSSNFTAVPQSVVSQMTNSAEFVPTGTASLQFKGSAALQ